MAISQTVHRSLAILVVVAVILLSWCTSGRAEEPAAIEVAFTADADGTLQQYVVLLPPAFDPAASHDVLVALHGHGSDRWQFVKNVRDECRAARDVAARHGMLFVSPDYRAPTSWMGPRAEQDLVQVIADVKRTYRTSKVFVCGGSMGGTACLTFGVLHPELVDGVASMNGTANLLEYENFQDAIKESFGGSKAEKPLEYKKRSAEYWPEKLTMPVGITASGKDTAVPPESVVRLARVLQTMERRVLLIYREDAEHATSYEDAVAVLEFVIQP